LGRWKGIVARGELVGVKFISREKIAQREVNEKRMRKVRKQLANFTLSSRSLLTVWNSI
jgi:hypothetical protein